MKNDVAWNYMVNILGGKLKDEVSAKVLGKAFAQDCGIIVKSRIIKGK